MYYTHNIFSCLFPIACSVSFLPLSLLVQFLNVVNVFYLLNGVLQFFPSIQTISPIGSYAPLAFVVVTGVIKEAVIDYKRYVQDKQSNGRKCMAHSHSGGVYK